jgi:hypothetical protein
LPLWPVATTPARAWFLDGRLRKRLRFQNLLPVEFDIWIVFLDPADRFFVERRPPDFDARRRTKPIENAMPRSPAAANSMYERGCFIPAFVASKPQKWQSYLRLVERPIFLAGFAAAFFKALTGFFFCTLACFGGALGGPGFATGTLAATWRPSAGAL